MAPPSPDADDATLPLEDAVKTLYLRVALVAQRLDPKGPAYFHLVKAGDRLARAYQAAVRDRVGKN